MQVDRHIIDKINDYHDGVVSSSKDAISNAVKAGEELARARGMCEHGEFLAIVASGFKFSQRTAYRYIDCFEYATKLSQLANLQEAYKLIDSEEAKKKQAKSVEQVSKFNYRKQYDEKPGNWDRADDYAWSKHIEAQTVTDERIAQAKQQMNQQSEAKSASNAEYEQATEYLKSYVQSENDKTEKLGQMNIVNQNSNILGVIGQYLNSLDTDSKKIEECHNIIKFCKNLSVDMQKKR